MLRACEFAARLSFEMVPGRARGHRRAAPRGHEERRRRASRRSCSTRSAAAGGTTRTASGPRPDSSARSCPSWAAPAAARAAEGTAEGLLFALLREIDARSPPARGSRTPRSSPCSSFPSSSTPCAAAAARAPRRPRPDPPRPRGRRESARAPDVASEPHDAHRQARPRHAGTAHEHAPGGSRRAPPRRQARTSRPPSRCSRSTRRASGRYREAAAAWEEVVERGLGTRALHARRFPTRSCRPPEPVPPAPGGRSPPAGAAAAAAAAGRRSRAGRRPDAQRARRFSQSARSDSSRAIVGAQRLAHRVLDGRAVAEAVEKMRERAEAARVPQHLGRGERDAYPPRACDAEKPVKPPFEALAARTCRARRRRSRERGRERRGRLSLLDLREALPAARSGRALSPGNGRSCASSRA